MDGYTFALIKSKNKTFTPAYTKKDSVNKKLQKSKI